MWCIVAYIFSQRPLSGSFCQSVDKVNIKLDALGLAEEQETFDYLH